MNFLADESVDKQIVDRLREDGHVIWYVAEMEPGISDEEVLDLSNQQRAMLLTADTDFGELVFRQGRLALGVILIRLAGLSQITKSELVASAVNDHASELPQGFAVITPGVIRIRRQIM